MARHGLDPDCDALDFTAVVYDLARGTVYEPEAQYYYACELEFVGRKDDAIAEYKELIRKFPDTWWAYKAQQALKELQQSGK